MKKPIEQRFWPKVNKNGSLILDTPCWEWTALKSRHGYGLINKNGKPVLATRIAWELLNGPIPNGLHVLHECDNPACVRHLFLGTHRDNMDDMIKKGRGRTVIGSAKKSAKLNEEQIKEIRTLFATGNYLRKDLAPLYGVGARQIGVIIGGRQWKHV